MTLDLETAAAVAEEMSTEERALAETAERNGRRRISEPLVYGFDARSSYWADRMAMLKGDSVAGERMGRHAKQMVDAPKPEKRFAASVNYEYRVNPSVTKGQGEEFAPPLWAIELFATAPRPGKCVQLLAPTFDLPPGVSSVNLPRITQGTLGAQQTDLGAVQDQDVETATVTSQVATFTGLSDWAIQALEQSPPGAHLDWAIFKDLYESTDAEIEKEIILGTGKNRRFTGLIELAGINKVTYETKSPTGTTIFPKVGEALAQVGGKRKLPPEAILMNTGRFFWASSSEDLSNRPLLLEDYAGSMFPIAGWSGIGVYPDDAIPNNLGTTKEQDVIICCRPTDFMIFADQPRTAVMIDVVSGTLQVRFELHRYVAALLGRYPTSVSVVEGEGMKVQKGFS